MIKWLLLFLVACGSIVDSSCDRASMGFAFYPGAIISNDAASFVNSYSGDSDLLLLHFGDKVPWSFLRNCDDVDSCASKEFISLFNQLRLHADNFKGVVYVSISPLDNERSGVAKDWDGSDSGFSDFSSEELSRLYVKWADYVKKKFSPDYFSQGIEINMYSRSRPEDFGNLWALLKLTKSDSLGPTIQWEFFKDDWGTDKNLELLVSDWDSVGVGYAFSTYPEILDVESGYSFSSFGFNIGNKPVFISESGISSAKQEAFLSDLFNLRTDYNLQGIVWFFKENDNKLLTSLPNEYPFSVFKDAGLSSGRDLWAKKFSCVL